MIKNKTVRIIYQAAYCALGLVGILASLGLTERYFNADFYVYYTNLSNYVCVAFAFASLVFTITNLIRRKDGSANFCPTLKFVCTVMIFITFFVYNAFLARGITAAQYFASANNVLMHLVLPIMFILDWVLFYEHGKSKWHYPLLSAAPPAAYLAFIFIRAAFVNKATTNTVYPYYFLDAQIVGKGGVALWIVLLLILTVAFGYAMYLLDNIKNITNKIKERKRGNTDK